MSRLAGSMVTATNPPLSAPYKYLSFIQLRKWFIQLIGREKTLQQLSTGETYAELLAELYPKAVEMKKIKLQPRNDMERIQNWKVVQNGLTVLKIDKNVPIVELIKPNSARQLDFCRWFISFYESNKDHQPPIPVRTSQQKKSDSNDTMIVHVAPIPIQSDASVIRLDNKTPDRLAQVMRMKTDIKDLSPGKKYDATQDINKFELISKEEEPFVVPTPNNVQFIFETTFPRPVNDLQTPKPYAICDPMPLYRREIETASLIQQIDDSEWKLTASVMEKLTPPN